MVLPPRVTTKVSPSCSMASSRAEKPRAASPGEADGVRIQIGQHHRVVRPAEGWTERLADVRPEGVTALAAGVLIRFEILPRMVPRSRLLQLTPQLRGTI